MMCSLVDDNRRLAGKTLRNVAAYVVGQTA
jgi:hypothetical protein